MVLGSSTEPQRTHTDALFVDQALAAAGLRTAYCHPLLVQLLATAIKRILREPFRGLPSRSLKPEPIEPRMSGDYDHYAATGSTNYNKWAWVVLDLLELLASSGGQTVHMRECR